MTYYRKYLWSFVLTRCCLLMGVISNVHADRRSRLWSRKSQHPTPGNFDYPTPTPTFSSKWWFFSDEFINPVWTFQEQRNVFLNDVYARSSLTFAKYNQAGVSLLIL